MTKISSYSQTVPGGFLTPAMDDWEEKVDLNKEYVPHPSTTFLVECSGDSMINAFIPPGAKLIVDRSINARNGDIVLAVVNGEFTVKYLKKNDFKCWLIPANRKYPDLEITAEMNMQVWGVVTTILTDVKTVRGCML